MEEKINIDAFCKWAYEKMKDKKIKCSIVGLKCYPSFGDGACRECYLREKEKEVKIC